MLGDATEEIAIRTGQTIGGLLNATFGNAVELILGIIALTKGLIRVVQASLLGSILSNLLLVLGMCFVAGGSQYTTQNFNDVAANSAGSLLLVACFGIIIPAALKAQVTEVNYALPNITENETFTQFLNETVKAETNAHFLSTRTEDRLLILSRGTSIILLIVYGLYLYFQLVSHKEMFEEGEDEEEEDPKIQIVIAVIGLIIITALVGICSEFLVGGIEDVVKTLHLSETFVGLILLPIVGNAAEHLTAVTVAYKNKMDLALGVALGSSIQIALMVTPLLVIIGWIIGQPMTLHFEVFETAVMFICVIVVNSLISDGSSNWLEGALLLGIYIIIGIAFFVF